ncbi:MAG: DUF1648 domain-containing protein [Haloferacaceae archaeon]
MVRPADLTAYALLCGSVLLGVVLWPALPARTAVHFGAGGAPDGYLAGPVGVVLVPATSVGAVLLVRHGPTWASSSSGPVVEDASVLFVGVTVAGLRAFVYAWNLDTVSRRRSSRGPSSPAPRLSWGTRRPAAERDGRPRRGRGRAVPRAGCGRLRAGRTTP